MVPGSELGILPDILGMGSRECISLNSRAQHTHRVRVPSLLKVFGVLVVGLHYLILKAPHVQLATTS